MRCSHWLALEGQEISMRPTIMYAAHWAINEPGVHAADLCLHGTRTPWGRWMIDDTRLKVCRNQPFAAVQPGTSQQRTSWSSGTTSQNAHNIHVAHCSILSYSSYNQNTTGACLPVSYYGARRTSSYSTQ
jgi:hypothetical protein